MAEPWSDEAVAWSLLGALVAALERLAPDGEAFAISELALVCAALAEIIDADTLDSWNDAPERTQMEVLAALGEAERRAGPSRFSPN